MAAPKQQMRAASCSAAGTTCAHAELKFRHARLVFHEKENTTKADDGTTVPAVALHTPTAQAHLVMNPACTETHQQRRLSTAQLTVPLENKCYVTFAVLPSACVYLNVHQHVLRRSMSAHYFVVFISSAGSSIPFLSFPPSNEPQQFC